MIDVFYPEHYKILQKEVFDTNVRLNQTLPDIKIRKTSKNGIRIGKTIKTDLDNETISSILRTFRINNADVLIREDVNPDQLIDMLSGNRKYIPSITIVNKVDLASPEQIENIKKIFHVDAFISAEKKEHIDELKEMLFQKLGLIRVYLKELGKKADMEEPLIIFKNSTLSDLCQKLHKDFITKFKFCRIWGESAKFDGQKILKMKHVLKDEDVIEIHLR